uniref:Uncharacterized protein n=1 Tax=Desulfovibrio sp. U5L TaxID=596152 RepID=I2Q2L8_9BACT
MIDPAALHDQLHHDLFLAGLDADRHAQGIETILAGRPYSVVMLLDTGDLQALRERVALLAGCVELAVALHDTLKKFCG